MIIHGDNMEYMRGLPDNAFDLAIADPPFGLGMDEHAFQNGINCADNGFKKHRKGEWDNAIPPREYFDELRRVSKNQIIWGGNYFSEYLPPVMSWIIWDKMQYNFSFSDGEMAWSSFGTKMKIMRYARGNESGFAPKLKAYEKRFANIHPTQKPVYLYRWLLKHYAKTGDKIFDPNGGGMGSAVACEMEGFEITVIEIDEYYYKIGTERLNHFQKHFNAQKTLNL